MSPKIGIVEDERIVAFNLQQRLTKLGYHVVFIAASGEQALQKISQDRPDLMLMDIHIEGAIDGIETATIISKEFKLPIIYLTAYSEESTLVRARETRPYGYLLKPFSERELHATIQMAMERYQIEAALNRSETRLRLALSAADMTDWELKKECDKKEMLYASQAEHILGYHQNVFDGTREEFLLLVIENDRAHVNQVITDSIHTGGTCDVEFRIDPVKKSQRWMRLQGKLFSENNSLAIHLVGIIQDITERKSAEHNLKQTATVFEALQDGILILDVKGCIIYCNDSFIKMTDLDLAQLLTHFPYFLTESAMRAEYFQELNHLFVQGGTWRHELNIARKNGDLFPVQVTIASVDVVADSTHDNLSRYVLVVTDLTEIRRVEQQLKYLAHHDPLTNLPNRLLTLERSNQAIARAKRNAERVALLFVDLDHFKWVNDSFGHSVGDELLQNLTEKMKQCLRSDDTIGRLGGDEFLIVLDPCGTEQSIVIVLNKLRDAVSAPLMLDGHTMEISCSIGVSLYPDDGQSSEALIRAADTAMYSAKINGRNCFEFCTPMMMDRAVRYMALNHDLHRGFINGELCLYYQPQISLHTNKVIGVEALIRWQHPEKGLLYPQDIIPIAEDNGLIIDIGEWVIKEACSQMLKWESQGISSLRMAVNVSALQVLKPNFATVVSDILQKSKINLSLFEIEITESVLQHHESCVKSLEALRNLGISIAIDDFGTGYSCLSSLKLLPIDRLKIDKSFIQKIHSDKNDVALTEMIIDIARKLNLQVIAEGVETETQFHLLKQYACNEAQGYFISKPIPEDVITRHLNTTLDYRRWTV
ncbi:MAG: EAL domain-containing protein [Undibacterium sp.]|nr:EAL domain-containing protein [Undibacterium sp.]